MIPSGGAGRKILPKTFYVPAGVEPDSLESGSMFFAWKEEVAYGAVIFLRNLDKTFNLYYDTLINEKSVDEDSMYQRKHTASRDR